MKFFTCLIVALIAASACSRKVCGCEPPLNVAVVWGQVTVDTGGAAAGAAMFGQATSTASCRGDSLVAWGHADSSGRYRLTVFGASILDSGCVFVGALFPPTQAGKDTIVGPLRMQFRPTEPLDSVNVNIVVRH